MIYRTVFHHGFVVLFVERGHAMAPAIGHVRFDLGKRIMYCREEDRDVVMARIDKLAHNGARS